MSDFKFPIILMPIKIYFFESYLFWSNEKYLKKKNLLYNNNNFKISKKFFLKKITLFIILKYS